MRAEDTPERFPDVDEQLLREMPELGALIEGHKSCSTCGVDKPVSDFHKDASKPDGLTTSCKPCNLARASKWAAENPERRRSQQDRYRERVGKEELAARSRRSYLGRNYNITPEQYDAMVDAQDGRCAICLQPPVGPFHIDHDHSCCPTTRSCGRCIRKLLCSKCNQAIGLLGDDADTVQRAVEYLRG